MKNAFTPSLGHGPVRYDVAASPMGELLLVGDERALSGLYMAGQRRAPAVQPSWRRDAGGFAGATEQLGQYFAGERTSFDLALAPVGTKWQLDVWRALLDIPYGATATYGELAARVCTPAAARAVGAANGRNPICVIVPCHRVVAAGGGLGGYAGGLERKRSLLELERETVPVAA